MKKILLILSLFTFMFLCVSCDSTSDDDGGNDGGGDKNPDVTQNLDINVEMHKIETKFDPMTETTYKYLYMGYYPQRLVKDTKYLEALAKITEVNDRGYIEYNGKEFLKYSVVNNHIYAQDPAQKTDEFFTSVTGFVPGNDYYFLVEPICWKIIKSNDYTGEYVLQTENIIDARSFNDTNEPIEIGGHTIYANNYEYSTIRAFLNNDFINLCFTEEEKNMLVRVNNENKAAAEVITSMDGYYYENTFDYVYLMSHQEATSIEYGFANNYFCHPTRFATSTEFAYAKGLVKNVVTDLNNKTVISSNWLTRTIFEFNILSICYVGYDGKAGWEYYPDGPNVGIRPCCTIKLAN